MKCKIGWISTQMKHSVINRYRAILGALALLPLTGNAQVTIISDKFTAPDETLFANHRPDTNLPCGTYTSNVGEYWGKTFISGDAAQLSTDQAEFIPIASTGGYVKPDKLTVSIDLNVGSLTTTEAAEDANYGAGLGFYPIGDTPRLHAPSGFTGLIVSPYSGNLSLFKNGVLQQSLPYKGTNWDAAIDHGLSYTVDVITGGLSNVVWDGATYSFDETDVFTDEATSNVGFVVSSSTGGKIAYFHNFKVVGESLPAGTKKK